MCHGGFFNKLIKKQQNIQSVIWYKIKGNNSQKVCFYIRGNELRIECPSLIIENTQEWDYI